MPVEVWVPRQNVPLCGGDPVPDSIPIIIPDYVYYYILISITRQILMCERDSIQLLDYLHLCYFILISNLIGDFIPDHVYYLTLN